MAKILENDDELEEFESLDAIKKRLEKTAKANGKYLTFEEIEKFIGGKLCEDAKRALLGANIRGVGVAIYFHKKSREDEMYKAWEFVNKHKCEIERVQRIEKLPQKEWEKIQKILNKYGK